MHAEQKSVRHRFVLVAMMQIGPMRVAVASGFVLVPMRVPRRSRQFGVHVRVVAVIVAVRMLVRYCFVGMRVRVAVDQ